MKNVFEMEFKTENAEKGCEVMDWLNTNDVQYKISLKGKAYVFDIVATRLQVAKVGEFFREM